MDLQETERALSLEIEKREQLERALVASEERLRAQEQSMSARLRQARRVEAIGTLASGIAHDFNNILAVISGNCELAGLVLGADSPARQYLTAIGRAGERAGDLVQQILTFTRNGDEQQRPTLIYVVVNEALKLLRASLPATIEFELDINRDMNYVMADVAQIYQIMIKLCTNAARDMEKEGGVLSVSLSQLYFTPEMVAHYSGLKSGPYLKLVIRDTGGGIAPELLKQIFDAHPALQDNRETTGLELAEIKEIVTAHNGKIAAHSRPGKGTTFTIILPIVDLESTQKQAGDEPPPTGSERILFLDDEPHLTKAGEKFLSGLGYRVSPFVESPKAWEIFKARPDRYDLVITDLTMPKMTGRQLAHRISALRPDLPLILCTGYRNTLTDDFLQPSGVSVVVDKPYALSHLAFTVRRLLDNPL